MLVVALLGIGFSPGKKDEATITVHRIGRVQQLLVLSLG
jgi:hypothetical protein